MKNSSLNFFISHQRLCIFISFLFHRFLFFYLPTKEEEEEEDKHARSFQERAANSFRPFPPAVSTFSSWLAGFRFSLVGRFREYLFSVVKVIFFFSASQEVDFFWRIFNFKLHGSRWPSWGFRHWLRIFCRRRGWSLVWWVHWSHGNFVENKVTLKSFYYFLFFF